MSVESPIDITHPEIEDEYQLSLDGGVEDESLNESGTQTFSITSYGADYPVDTLVRRMRGEAFFIPKFQRKFVWTIRHASRFIESLLMGLPVPGIFLYKEVSGKHLVVDGQQRLRTLQYFYDKTFVDHEFRLIGVSNEWEGRSYDDLSGSDKLKLDDSIIHATIFQQDEPKSYQKSLYFVFERINSGGIRLSPQEIRNCLSDNEILRKIKDINEDPNWRFVFGERVNSRLKDEELILRAIAMMAKRENYSAPMKEFLNNFASADPGISEADLNRFSEYFIKSIKLIAETLGKKAFRPQRALNAAVFEAVIIGVYERMITNERIDIEKFVVAYDKLLAEQDFQNAVGRATAREGTVKKRQELAISAFAEV